MGSAVAVSGGPRVLCCWRPGDDLKSDALSVNNTNAVTVHMSNLSVECTVYKLAMSDRTC